MKSRTRSKNLWKIKFFWDNAENAKNDANIFKTYFFRFSLFFAIFRFSKNFIKKMGKKLSNNKCLLFTILMMQNSSMFCMVSFIKKIKGKWFHYLRRPTPFEEKWSIFRGDLSTHTHTGLFSKNAEVTWLFLWIRKVRIKHMLISNINQ